MIATMDSGQEHMPPQSQPDDLGLSTVFKPGTPPRLGLELPLRLPISVLAAFASGMGLGFSHGSVKAAFKFRAENAHRIPTSSTGWYQYHKSKNYTSMIGGLKDGAKLGGRLAAGAMAFCIFEETVDNARHGQRDFLSTVTAGLSFSGIYSLIGTLLYRNKWWD